MTIEEKKSVLLSDLRIKIGNLLNEENKSPTARFTQWALIAVIVVSCCNLILATVPELKDHRGIFQIVEASTMLVFSMEYLARLWCRHQLGCAAGGAAFARYVLSPYMLVDLAVLIPFYASLFTDTGQDWLTILRILRLARLSRGMSASGIFWSACRSKVDEIAATSGLFLLLVGILAMGLYAVENPIQPENFSSFFAATAWVFANLIQGIGGYANFSPVTMPGQILATLCGISFIAVFAIPAGLIASGFMDELEERKQRKKKDTIRTTLDTAFMTENLSAHIRAKQKYNIVGPRQSLTLNDTIYRLFISHDDLLAAVRDGSGFQIKNYRWQDVEKVAILRFEENCPYGTFHDRGSSVTIVSTHSGDQAFMGHFTARLADALNANYLSSEKYFAGSMLETYRLQLQERDSYVDGSSDPSPIAELFKSHLAQVVRPGSLAVCILAAASNKEHAIHVLNGGELGLGALVQKNSTCSYVDKANAMLETLRARAEKNFSFTVGTHEAYGNSQPDALEHYLHRHLHAEALRFHVSVKCFNSGPDTYYGTIRLLADSIANLQA